ncbi:MAG: Ig-like domain-containing protein [Oscillospiraceae bacterium]|nr:Ig-like domain-containing protein [Oscillospiraceae bacterium]
MRKSRMFTALVLSTFLTASLAPSAHMEEGDSAPVTVSAAAAAENAPSGDFRSPVLLELPSDLVLPADDLSEEEYASAENYEDHYYRNYLLENVLNEDEKAVFLGLEKACEKFKASVLDGTAASTTFTDMISCSDPAAATSRPSFLMTSFIDSHPEYFFVEPDKGYYCTPHPYLENYVYVGTVKTAFSDVSALKDAIVEYDRAIDEFAQSVSAFTTDVEREKFICDTLADTVTYAKADHDQTAYGAIVDKTCVCAGYMRAFSHLCNLSGLKTISMHSRGHGWCKVDIDGKWYAVDPTWLDNSFGTESVTPDGSGGYDLCVDTYRYEGIFNVSDEALLAEDYGDGSHTAESYYENYPAAAEDMYDYDSETYPPVFSHTVNVPLGSTIELYSLSFPRTAVQSGSVLGFTQVYDWTAEDSSALSVVKSTENDKTVHLTALKEGTYTVELDHTISMKYEDMYFGESKTRVIYTVNVGGGLSVEPAFVTLTQTKAELTAEDTLSLTATVLPADATDKSVTWTSSNEKVAKVEGTSSTTAAVTAVSAGKATITASTPNGKTATCTVTVKDKVIEAASVSLDKTKAELTAEDTLSLTATVLPADAADKSVKWTSSNEKVARVEGTSSTTAAVTAVSAGKATITASTSNGKTATCTVTVTEAVIPAASIEVSSEKVSIAVNESADITAAVLPADATDKNITWTPSDGYTVSLEPLADANGVRITGLGEGTVVITASVGNVSEDVIVTVTAAEAPMDLDGDGIVTRRDVDLLSRHIMNRKLSYIPAFDINGDGVIDIRDVILLKKAAVL